MRCLVSGCDADELMVKRGVEVAYVVEGHEGSGRVCEDHVTLVAAGGFGASLGPGGDTSPHLALYPLPSTEEEVTKMGIRRGGDEG